MSNVKILLRPDGRYMIIASSTAPMLSEDGILGPYKIMGDRIYKNYPDLTQTKNEDPTVWHSGGLYHIVYNHWPTKTSRHFTSEDGIHHWTYRGIAFKKGEDKVFRYTDGTVNDWRFVERPTAYVENGQVTHFIFSVIDVGKGQDRGNDNHASKIVVVPFDGEAFDRDMQQTIAGEKNIHNRCVQAQRIPHRDVGDTDEALVWVQVRKVGSPLPAYPRPPAGSGATTNAGMRRQCVCGVAAPAARRLGPHTCAFGGCKALSSHFLALHPPGF